MFSGTHFHFQSATLHRLWISRGSNSEEDDFTFFFSSRRFCPSRVLLVDRFRRRADYVLRLDFPDRASFVLPWMDDGTVYRCLPCHGRIDTVEAQGVVALVASGGDV